MIEVVIMIEIMIEVVMYSLSFFDPPNNQISTLADCKVQTKSCEESLMERR